MKVIFVAASTKLVTLSASVIAASKACNMNLPAAVSALLGGKMLLDFQKDATGSVWRYGIVRLL